MNRHDVAIVGGGVVGAALAAALARESFDVALIERGAAPSAPGDAYDPRVLAIAPAARDWLRALGAWQRLVRAAPYVRMQVWDADVARALTFSAADAGAEALGCIVEESALRAALWAAAGPTRILGREPAQIRASGERVHLRLDDGHTLDAALVVSAEGAASRLRELAGIGTAGWGYDQQALVCHVDTAMPHGDVARQRFLPRGPLAFLPLADGRSSIVWSTAASEAQALLALSAAEFHARLGDAIQHVLGEIRDSSARLTFPLRRMHAQEYVRPGLALVGDSAHVVHPLAGQGVNLGLADAAALTTVLVTARERRQPLAALRTLKRYERARRAANAEMLLLTDALQRLFAARGPGAGAALNAVLNAGLGWVDRAGPVKRALARRAMGL